MISMQPTARSILALTFTAIAYAITVTGFVLFQVEAGRAISHVRKIRQSVEFGRSLQHLITLFNACRWTVLGVGIAALLSFAATMYASKYSSKRIFQANWGRGEKEGLKKKSRIIRILLLALVVLLFITGSAAITSAVANMKAMDTVSNSNGLVQSGDSLLTQASSTLTTLKGGNSTSSGLGGLIRSLTSLSSPTSSSPSEAPSSSTGLSGLFNAFSSLAGDQNTAASPPSSSPSSSTGNLLNSILSLVSQSSTTDASGLYSLLTRDNLQNLAPVLRQTTVGTLLDALDTTPSGVLQLVAAVNGLLNSGSNQCGTGCLQTGDACVCGYAQLQSISSAFDPTYSNLRLALIGSCILIGGLALLLLVAFHELSSYGFQEGLVYSDRFDRQLAVKHAMQTRRNLNLTASTPGIVPSPHVETPVQPPKADKVEVV